jgi:hypothetical protein
MDWCWLSDYKQYRNHCCQVKSTTTGCKKSILSYGNPALFMISSTNFDATKELDDSFDFPDLDF